MSEELAKKFFDQLEAETLGLRQTKDSRGISILRGAKLLR